MVDTAVAKHLKVQIQGVQAESMTVTFNALLDSAGGTFVNGRQQGRRRHDQPRPEADRRPPRRAEEAGRLRSAADPELNTANEDSSRAAFEKGGSALRDQLPVHLPERRGGEGTAGGHRLGPLPGGRRRQAEQAAAGRVQHRHRQPQQAPDSRCRRCAMHRAAQEPARRGGEGRQPADLSSASTTRSTRSSTRSRPAAGVHQ